MSVRFFLLLVCVVAVTLPVRGDLMSGANLFESVLSDWAECWAQGPGRSECLAQRTSRSVRGASAALWDDLDLAANGSSRSGKALESDAEVKTLETENESISKEIESRRSTGVSRGLVDDIGDFIAYFTTKLLSPFMGEKSADDGSDEDTDAEEKQAFEEFRGHKKKELRKKNKQLKLILLLMLFKNKIKMFVNKLQFLVQLKFLGVATINMLVNFFRLWLELKKKHKPNKVVFYENAHHQHHYDHEHIHDDGHYSGHPYSHFATHDDEEYGGGPWPWSRSYYESSDDQASKNSSPYRYSKPGPGYSVAYYQKRNS